MGVTNRNPLGLPLEFYGIVSFVRDLSLRENLDLLCDLVYFELVYIESNSIRKRCLKEPYTPKEFFPVKYFQGY